MHFSGFTGPSYTERSIIVAAERTVNWYTSLLESDQFKSRYAMYRTPGLGLFVDTLLGLPVRGKFSQNGRCFFVVGNKLVEVLSNQTFVDHSTLEGVNITNDDLPALMEANPTQLMIVSGGNGYIFTLSSNDLVQISAGDFPTGTAKGLAYQDGYFIVSILNTGTFQLSALNDGLTWDAGDTSNAESKPDYILALASLREELWIFGSQTIQLFVNTGAEFPFVPNQQAIIEYGIGAAASLTKVDNSLFWLVVNENGGGMIARAQGYSAKRISNYAMEAAMSTYPTLADAEGQAVVSLGHSWYRITFPSARGGRGATWQMDVNTGQWIELSWWNGPDGEEEAHRARVYTYAFGKLLCGDRENGKIYELSMAYLDDNGDSIRRVRRAPHLVKDRNQVSYSRLRFDGNTGIGLNVVPTALGYDPQMLVRWSDDGGRSWGPPRQIRFGKYGETNCLPQTDALGVGRDRVFECIVSDPVDWAIAGAYFEAKLGRT